jgi:hypothetical protein
VLPSRQKLTLGLPATIALKIVLFRAYHRSECMLDVMFCDSAQLCLRFCLHQLSRIKIVAFEFYLLSGKPKSRVRGRRKSCFSVKKIQWWKRKCEMVHCHDTTASYFFAKVRGEVFAHFHAVSINRHSSMQNSLFVLSGRILCEQLP